MKQARLPSEYQEVEWIGCYRLGPYINPCIQNNSSISWYIKFMPTDIYGVATSDFSMLIGDNSRPQIGLYTNGWCTGNAGSPIPYLPTIGNIYEMTWNHDGLGSVFVDRLDTGMKRTGNGEPYLFYGKGYTAETSFTGRAYSVLFIDRMTNSYLRNFIPCYRKSDNKPGLYDLAGSIFPRTNSPFYINVGGGEFTVGPDVN